MSIDLRQLWEPPTTRRPIVIFGAGSIVRDAHLPAYAAGGYTVAGITDPDRAKAEALAAEHGTKALSVDEALAVDGAVFDLATPPAVHASILRDLPEGAPVLIQKPLPFILMAIFIFQMKMMQKQPLLTLKRVHKSLR